MTSRTVSGRRCSTAGRALAAGLLTAALALGSAPVSADPPPWAPAHGWRAKHAHKHDHHRRDYYEHDYRHGYYEHDYRHGYQHGGYQPRGGLPFDLGFGTCNRDLIGALIGGAAGGAVGSTIGKGRGNTAAIIGGAVLGAIVGGVVGRNMDQADHACTGQVLEHVEDGRTVRWDAPAYGKAYEVTPLETYQAGDGRYCREYVSTAVIAQKIQQVYGTACRQPDGSWQLVS